MKFLHAADIHLDSPLEGLERYEGAPVDLIRNATRRALENLVELALHENVDFVVIAGDLYDGNWRDFNTGMFFVRQMSRLSDAGIPVYLIAGNHDAVNTMTRKLRLPTNRDGLDMMLSHELPETRRLDDLGVAIHGRSFANQAELKNMVPAYPAPIPQWFNVGMLHTSLNGSEEHDTYAPCTPDDLRSKGYGYWALGHIHKRSKLLQDGFLPTMAPALYSGNIQGRHIREPGARGCFLVELDDQRKIQVTFRPLDVFRWEVCTVQCDESKNLVEIFERFGQELRTIIARSENRPLGVRVVIEGATDVHQELTSTRDAVTAEIRSSATVESNGRVWIERVKIATKYPAKSNENVDAEGPLAELERYLDELSGSTESLEQLGDELKDLARKLPSEVLQPPDGLPLNQVDWLREIVRDLKPIILERLKG
jgi:DNA repair exonuclease SbcCD nuclease subunit